MARPRPMSKMKRLELVVEKPVLQSVIRVVEKHATGYTIVPHITGFGEHGRREDDIALMVVVTTGDHVEQIIDAVMPLLNARSGIALVSEVAVMRAEHFVPEVRAARLHG